MVKAVSRLIAFIARCCTAGAFVIAPPSLAADTALDYAGMMRSTVDGWLASQLPGGLFPYGFDFLAGAPMEPDQLSPSNLIRQAGTASALAAYYRHSHDTRVVEPIQRILEAFGRYSLPMGKSRRQHWVEQTRILSMPFARWKLHAALEHFGMLYQTAGDGSVLSGDGTYESALAGTVALALLTELTYSDAARDNRFAGLRSAWLRGLLDLRIPGGGFRRTPASIEDSDYFNGEGWLAVAVYVDLHPDDVSAAGALGELDRALMQRYTQRPNPSFYHWGAMAAAQRYATSRDPEFLAFLRSQAALFLKRFQPRHDATSNNCADMEGVAAALEALDRSGDVDTELTRRARAWLLREAAKLPYLQIRAGQTSISLGGNAELRAPALANFAGTFLAGLYRPSTRVDHAQHCLSAMIMLHRGQTELPRK